MQLAKQQALSAIAKLPESVSLDDIIKALQRFKETSSKIPEHPVDQCFGVLGKGRRTDNIIAELRDEL